MLHESVVPDECCWGMERPGVVYISLQKQPIAAFKKAVRPLWPCLITGDLEIEIDESEVEGGIDYFYDD